MTLDEATQALRDLSIDGAFFNILGEPKDFAFNLVANGDDFDLYYQEKGLRTYVKRGEALEATLDTLVLELEKDFG